MRSERSVEPHRLVSLGRRWYLVAYDLSRLDWRSFRLGWLERLRSDGTRFRPRELPAEDAAAFARRRPIGLRTPLTVRTLSGRCKLQVMSDAVVRHPRRHRLEVRVTPEQDALIRHAADLEDTTVTAFVLDTVTARATTVIEQRRDLVLSNEAFDRFIAELDKPPAGVPQLSRLFRRHPELPEA